MKRNIFFILLAKHLNLLFLFTVSLFFQASLFAEPEVENSCIVCHEDMWEEMKGSIHSQNHITCHHCHGGNPRQMDLELAKSKRSGFIGIPNKKKLVEVCGECHADVELMNPYNIRTDQLALYKTSTHGKRLLYEGDEKVAACSDCHGYHNVVLVTDSASPVYPLNLPETCNQCHGNEKLMEKYSLPADIFETYRDSVHGQALYEKKDTSVANCAKCHGSHGAVPPGVNKVGAVCGNCHVNEKKYFEQSVHVKAMGEGKFSGCISCHGNHGVQKTKKEMYDFMCVECHAKETTAYQKGQKILTLLQESENALAQTEALVRSASIQGLFVENEMAALEKEKTNVISLAPTQHTLSLDKIEVLHKSVISVSENIKNEIQKKRRYVQWRKLSLIPIWIFVLILSWAFWQKFKQLKKEDDETKS